ELLRVEVRRAGEPDAGDLDRNEVVAALGIGEQHVAAIFQVEMDSRIGEHAFVEPGEVAARGLNDSGGEFRDVNFAVAESPQYSRAVSGAESDEQSAAGALGE